MQNAPHATRNIYLVRHGATDANLREPPILQGRGLDYPLSEIGIRQATATRDLLRSRPIRQIFTSPLRRAVETARLIAEPFASDVVPVELLTECSVGRWEGLSWAEIEQREPARCAAFLADPDANGYPDGESFGDVAARSLPVFRQCLERCPDGEAVFVSHNIVLRIFVAHLVGLTPSRARVIRQDNCGVSVLADDRQSFKLISSNSTFHLP